VEGATEVVRFGRSATDKWALLISLAAAASWAGHLSFLAFWTPILSYPGETDLDLFEAPYLGLLAMLLVLAASLLSPIALMLGMWSMARRRSRGWRAAAGAVIGVLVLLAAYLGYWSPGFEALLTHA
jgi:hypothetical protein